MIRWLLLPWWWMQRRADMRLLWPICRQFTSSLEEAHEAFLLHASMTPCWIDYYGSQELLRRVRALK